MDWKFLRSTGRYGARRVPNNYFGEYFSPGFSTAPEDSWVTGRFSSQDENILFIGSDTGHVCVVDVDCAPNNQAEAFKYYFRAHPGVVMDILPVPGNREELLTMCGFDIRIWSLGSPIKSSLFLGHDAGSVRAACFAPENSSIFATGGRDGSIFMWDRRVAPLTQNGQKYRRPSKEYRNCHLIKPQIPIATVGGGRRRSERNTLTRTSSSITSMTYLDEYTIVTSSESGKSGIRLWDTRRAPVREESRPIAVLELPSNSRDIGVSSISLDRFKSSLFAVSTDNCIHEFHPNSGRTDAVRSYVGASIGADFYTQMACSPISDHILCGSGDNQALVWDAQKFHSSIDRPYSGPASLPQKGIRPVLSLGGHRKRVSTVGYSPNAMYMLTMDDCDFRVWRHMPVCTHSLKDADEMLGVSFERVERVYERKEDEASSALDRFSITPGPRLFLSPTKAGMAPLQKRKEPFRSPFKSSSIRLFDDNKENIPPGTGKKMLRLDDVSFPSLEDKEEEKKEKEEEERRRKKNPFYYEHATMHLPNLVYERYVEEQKGEGKKHVETETITKSGRKVRTLVCWAKSSTGRLSKESVPSMEEFPGSACAHMISTGAVPPVGSPRKLQLRPPLSDAAAAGRRSSARNIYHYFNKTVNKTADKE